MTVTETVNLGYSLYYWSLDGTNVGSAVSYSVSMNSTHTLTALFRGRGSISLTLSSNSLTLGNSVTLSGQIAPAQSSPGISAGSSVFLSINSDGGATWNVFTITQTDGTGSYSVAWYPPYANSTNTPFQVKASWSGGQNYAGAENDANALIVRGSSQTKMTLLITGPTNVTRGGAATFGVLVTDFGSSITTTPYVEIDGPGYSCFDARTISLNAKSSGRIQFTWQAPSNIQAGSYKVTVGLNPPRQVTIDQLSITVSLALRVR